MEKKNMIRKVTIRLKMEEYLKVEMAFRQTTQRTLSEYIRDVLLLKPVTFYTRDRSMDDSIVVCTHLQKQLSAIGNNFNQVVRKLQASSACWELQKFATESALQQRLFIQQCDQINSVISKIFTQWLQE